MDVLETALSPILHMVNRQISAKTPARQLCDELDGQVFAVRVKDTALAAYIRVHERRVSLSSEFAGEPDVAVCGSLLSLLKLAGSGERSIREGSVEFSGDAEIAEQFRKLLRYGKPDLEEELSNVVGDVAAHSLGELLRSVGRWGRTAGATMRQNVTEYLQEESRTVPSRYEVENFRDQVNVLRDDVARFANRLRDYENRPDSSDVN